MEGKEGPQLLRPDAVLKILDIGRSTLYELIRQGVIPSVRLGKSIRIPRQELEAWIRAQAAASTTRAS